jgi:hypothetical protein
LIGDLLRKVPCDEASRKLVLLQGKSESVALAGRSIENFLATFFALNRIVNFVEISEKYEK